MTKKIICVLLVVFLSINLCMCSFGSPDADTHPTDPLRLRRFKTGANLTPQDPTLPSSAEEGTATEPTEEAIQDTEPTEEQTEPTGTEVTEETNTPETAPPETTSPETLPAETDPPETVHRHSFETTTYPPDCINTGFDLSTCSCGESYTENHTDALGHNWSQWETVLEATTSREGEKMRFCSRCGAEEFQSTEKKSISYGNTITLDERFDGYQTAGFTCLLAYPSEADFGVYTEQAIALYTAITEGQESITVSFPIDEYRDLESTELRNSVEDIIDGFEKTFAEKVLNGYCRLSVTKTSYYSGTATYAPADMCRSLEKNAAKEYAIYDAVVRAGVTAGMSERTAVQAINDWICSIVSYGSSYSSPQEVLENRNTNCTGYALLFHAMCQSIGIDCQLATGQVVSGGEVASHAWNRVQIGSDWYFIDICWNDASIANCYYLSEELWDDHILQSCETSIYY